ncbi:hypothetical protein [Catellatospora sichuanensis]|uniref:hypothetical protein n=1 Tax=Catellatospora sichuanensis TaxID=1969805 RepID=UPI0011840B20|nr:hypothetical protein [Catellatospora sichuanensis]
MTVFGDLTGDNPNDPARSVAIALRGSALMDARPGSRLLADAVKHFDVLPHLAVVSDGHLWVWHFIYHRDVDEAQEQFQAVLASIEQDEKWAQLGIKPCAGPGFETLGLPRKMRGSNVADPRQLVKVRDSAVPGVQQYRCSDQRSKSKKARRYGAVAADAIWGMSDARQSNRAVKLHRDAADRVAFVHPPAAFFSSGPTPTEVTADLLLSAVAGLQDQHAQVSLLEDLLPYLHGFQVQQVLDLIPVLDEHPRGRLICALAEVPLSAAQVGIVFDAIITDEDLSLVGAIATLMPRLTPEQRAIAVPAATTWIADAWGLTDDLLQRLAPHLSAPELAVTLDRIRAAIKPAERTGMLILAAPHLTAEQRDGVLDDAIAPTDANIVAAHLGRLAPHLDRQQLVRALNAVCRLTDCGGRARALAALIPHLPDEERASAVRAALSAVEDADPDDLISNIALHDLLPHLRPEQLDKVVDTLQATDDPWRRELLAPYLQPEQQQQVLEVAGRACATDPFRSMSVSISHLPADQQRSSIDRALATLRTHRGLLLPEDLMRIAPAMTAGQIDTLLEILSRRDDRARIVVGLSAFLNHDQLDRVLATFLHDADEHPDVLTTLIPHLDGEQQQAALSALIAIDDPARRCEHLARAAELLPAPVRAAAVAAALTAAGEIGKPRRRAAAYIRLSELVGPERRRLVLVQAYLAAMRIKDESARIVQLGAVASACLSGE